MRNLVYGLLILLTILLANSQHFQTMQTGMVKLEPLSFSTNNLYRDFTIVSPTPSLLINGSLVFSFISFNYFYNQIYCYKSSVNQSSIIIKCSPNVQKISYLIFEKSPNIFVLYQQKSFFQRDSSFYSIMNVSFWRNQIKIPLKGFIKNQPISISGNQQKVQNQYEFKTEIFISGFQTFSYFDVENGSFSGSRSKITNLQILPIYANISVDSSNTSTLYVPVGVNISRSLNIKKIAFFTLIIIKEMPSLNLIFQPLVFQQTSGNVNFSQFSGVNSLQFIIGDAKIINSLTTSQKLQFNMTYSISPKPLWFFSNYTGQQKFFIQKLYIYNKSSNLKIKFTKLSNSYWIRCYGSQVNRYEKWTMPKQGKYYKIMTSINLNYVMSVSGSSPAVLYEWNNTLSQKFYFQYLGEGLYKIISAQTNLPLRAVKNKQTFPPINTLSVANPDQDVWQIVYYTKNGKIFYLFRSVYYSVVDLLAFKVQNNQPIVHYKQYSNANQLWIVEQVLLSNSGNVSANISGINSNLIQSQKLAGVYSISNLNYVVNYYPTYNSYLSVNQFLPSTTFGFYSLQNQICYSQACVNLQNIYNQTQTSYIFELQKLMSNVSNFQSIITQPNLTNNGSYYSFCINNNTLQQFLINLYNIYTTIYGSNNQDLMNGTSGSGLYFGCSKLKGFSMNQSYIECQKCIQGYILYNAVDATSLISNTIVNNSSFSIPINHKNCYCNYGFFMDTLGACHSCQLHPTNCKVNTKLSLQIRQITTSTLSKDQLKLTIQIINSRQKLNIFTDLAKYADNLIVFINTVKYKASERRVLFVKNQEDLNTINIQLVVSGVMMKDQYEVYVTTQGGNSDIFILIEQEYYNETMASNAQNDYQATASQNLSSSSTFSSQQSYQKYNKLYFTKLQTSQITITKPFQFKKMALQSLNPVIQGLNKSSSVILIVSPFIMDKINLFSILQTNTLLYFISFLKFNSDQKMNLKNEIVKFANQMFIFKPQPFINIFSLNTNSQSQQLILKQTLIKVPPYQTNFASHFLYTQDYHSTLHYPPNLYINAIPSLNPKINGYAANQHNNSHNYLTITLNSLINILIQILVIELFVFVVNFSLSKYKQKTSNEQKKGQAFQNDQKIQNRIVKIAYEIKRHLFVKVGREKYIQWLPMPDIQNMKINNINQQRQENNQGKFKSNSQHLSSSCMQNPRIIQLNKSQQASFTPTLRHHVLLFTQNIKQKKLVFYTSFIMIQLISQSYLLYFEVIKPFHNQSEQQFMNYLDYFFGMLAMFVILIFPVFLINYQPLNLLKLVQITYKFNYNRADENKKSKVIQWNNPASRKTNQQNLKRQEFLKSCPYTYSEIFFHFCIVYYQNIFIAYSVAIGTTIFYQSLPISIYQFIKLIWMYKRMKIFDKIKTLFLMMIFGISSCWRLFDGKDFVQNQVLTNVIIWSIYMVLVIQLLKLGKFFVVTGFKFLRTKIQEKKTSENGSSLSQQSTNENINKVFIKSKTSNKVSSNKQSKDFQIFQIEQQQNTTHMVKQLSNYNQQQTYIGSQKIMLEKGQKLQKIKQKSQMLKQLTQLRQNLKNDLEDMKIRRRNQNRNRRLDNLQIIEKDKQNNNQNKTVIENENNKQEQIIKQQQQYEIVNFDDVKIEQKSEKNQQTN